MLYARHLAVAVALGGFAVAAPAALALDNPTGPYVGVRLGVNLVDDLTPQDQYQPRVPIAWEYDAGYGFSFLAGYKMSRNLRIELEYNHSLNDLGTFSVNGVSPADNATDTATNTYLFNAYWEFPIFEELPLIPYVGGGIGTSQVRMNAARVSGGGATVVVPNVGDYEFAWQLGFGATWEFDEAMAVDLGYRYLATENPRFGSVVAEYHAHSLLAGLRYHF